MFYHTRLIESFSNANARMLRMVHSMLVGYSLEQKGYKCYSPSTRKVQTSRDVVFDETTSWYAQEKIPTPTTINAESAEQEKEGGDHLEDMFEDSPITTRLSGPREPPSDQSTLRPSLNVDKGGI